MFQFIKTRYDQGKYTIEQMKKLVVNGWITDLQFEEITDEEYIA